MKSRPGVYIMDTSRSVSNHAPSVAPSPSGHLVHSIEDLQALQWEIPLNVDELVKHPEQETFPEFPPCFVHELEIDQDPEHCVILLHDKGQNEESLKNLARRLRICLPECAFLRLRGPTALLGSDNSYQWTDPADEADDGFFRSCRHILKDIVYDGLIKRCHFRPRDIVFLGHGQGSLVALRAASIWNETEFGGMIAVGYPLPAHSRLFASIKAQTPVLIIQASDRHIEPQVIEELNNIFPFVELGNRLGGDKDPPTGLRKPAGFEDELKPYVDFLVHRLRRDEWRKQDIISFDGGGIRGYGSLLILKALMEEIAAEERRRDGSVKSSFDPCPFKPKRSATEGKSESDSPASNSSRTDSNKIEAELLGDHLPEAARFLPCHYFTYAAGTSTGGLISIMLQRFRMTVDECIQEYKTLGGEVFGHPRPPVINRLRPKFDERRLERIIKDVCKRRGEVPAWEDLSYNLKHHTYDDDMCRCMVLAVSDQENADSPYHFRTYRTPPARKGPNPVATVVQNTRGYGDPSQLAIWKVARATSAAPKYFAPIEIESGDGIKHRFVDGGFGCNNPTREIYDDVVHKHGENSLGLVVSIGTGETELKHTRQRNHVRDTFYNLWLATKLPTRTTRVNEDMDTFSKREGFDYIRFYGGKQLGEMAMDEWKSHKVRALMGRRSSESGQKTLNKISDAVDDYLKDRKVKGKLRNAAQLLVERRRLRVRDASKWDRFASFSYYSCESEWHECTNPRWRTVDEFREHIKKEHRVNSKPEVIEKHISKGRRCNWVYRP